jgi:tetratricopeptide (TPR) repeat protein
MSEQHEQVLALYQRLQQAADPSEAVLLSAELLTLLQRDQAPLLWANLQGAYGASLAESTWGQWTEERVSEVVGAYGAALTVYDPETNALEWGQTQRNVGATYLGALNAGVGNAHYVEAAIAAYENALLIPRERHNDGVWASAQSELAAVAAAAVPWRGEWGHIRAARAYAELLAVVDRKSSPAAWAQLQLDVAFHLANAVSAGVGEQVIVACDAALTVLDRDADPERWAEAHLLRGSEYRTRKGGQHDENLEHAVASLDHALDMFTPESSPGGWRTAHYHRGPAYLHRVHGERAQNLQNALESLQVASDEWKGFLPADAWGALVVSLGQVYLERGSIEVAIATIEPVLPTLPPASPVLQLANRVLGQAYVARTNDDQQKNRAAAIAHLAAALEFPAESWSDAETWAWTTALLARLELDEKAEWSPRPSDSTADPPAQLPMQFSARDVFDMAGHARRLAIPETPLDLDPAWHVPWLLNEEAGLLRRHFSEFLKSGTMWMRTPEERSALERGRSNMVALLSEHLMEKRAAASRVRALLEQVARGEQAFVLMLRGFGMRMIYFAGASVGYGGGVQLHETTERHRIAQELAPVPVVWIANPIDSGPMEAAEVEGTAGHRVESGAEWERDVRGLMTAASFIVVYNPVMTDGVRSEITALKELGRLGDTFFSSADSASEVAEVPCSALTNERLEMIRERAKARPVDRRRLPDGTCPWIEGPSREHIERELRALSSWAQRLTRQQSPVALDLRLDSCAYRFAGAVLAERIDVLPSLFDEMAAALSLFGADDLPEAGVLAENYSRAAESCRRVLQNNTP